jgi:2-methylcitrate dehydratase PrpD
LEAAYQAAAGMTAPPLPVWVQSIVPRANHEPTWEAVLSTYIKPYPACRLLHGAIEAASAFKAAENWPVADIAQIDVEAPGADFIATRATADTSPKRCQFSLPYNVACMLMDGEVGERQLRVERIAAPDIQELQRRIAVRIKRPAGRPDGRRTTRIDIHHRDGRIYSTSIDWPKGSRRNPFTREELIDKFNRWTESSLSEVQRQRVCEMVFNIENVPDIRLLTAQLGGPEHVGLP